MLSEKQQTLIVKAIVSSQSLLIGPLAIEQANKVPGIRVDEKTKEVIVQSKDPHIVITQLVEKYEELFGYSSIEVCKDAIREIKADISPKDLPAILQ